MELPFDRTWWVEEGSLLAGPYPGSADLASAQTKLRALLAGGIRTFVSLLEPDETNYAGHPFAAYEDELRDMAAAAGVDVELHRYPIPDYGIVGPEAIRRVLDTIERSIAEGRPVYLHCWGGHGRTGTIVGCRLRESGLDGEEALARIAELRQHSPYLRSMDSPQTDRQQEVVRNWSA